MTDKQIIKLNELTEMSQELGLYEDRPDWRITLQADHIKRLEEELKAKEQECEELKETLKTKAKGWANVNDKILEEIDQLKEQLEAYKMEAEEGKEINAELKADNKHLNGLLDQALKELEEHREALEKVKEIAEKNHKTEEELFKIRHSRLPKVSMGVLNGKHNLASEILQICDEVNKDEYN